MMTSIKTPVFHIIYKNFSLFELVSKALQRVRLVCRSESEGKLSAAA